MTLTFNSADVLQVLAVNASVMNGKNTLPILDNFLLSAKGDHSIITTSDNEIWLSIKANTQSDEEFRVCLNANDVLKALRNLDGGEVNVEFDKDSHIATFKYNGGYFKIPFLDDEFPALPDKSNVGNENLFTMTQQQLRDSISNVSFAVSNDQLRPIMNGVHFDFFSTGLVTAATDSFMLAKYTDESITNNGFGDTPQFTMPTKVASVLKNVLNDGFSDVRFNENYLVVEGNNFVLTARLVEGKYPNYNVVIPQGCNYTAFLKKDELLSALKRVMPMGDSNSELVKLNFNSFTGLTISTANTDFNTSAEETINCEFSDSEITIGLKGSILMEILRNTNATDIHIEMTEPTRPSVIYGGDKKKCLALIMPMAI